MLRYLDIIVFMFLAVSSDIFCLILVSNQKSFITLYKMKLLLKDAILHFVGVLIVRESVHS